MDRLRRSFRDSFRRRKKVDRVPESSKPHQWQADEAAVRGGDCSFPVKYLGCVEVFDSRGMNICEEALKLLRNSRRRPVKGVLYVTGDGLRVVDDETKGLIVDQTIEKVSFCAPDRNYEKGFSYICRDGTTRRWMCHGFQAKHDSGERLSHAVGCAFAVCLERKQKRDKEVAVTMNFDKKSSTFTRNGSFRQSTITERLKDPQFVKPAEPPPVKQVYNPFAIDRPHATVQTLERQGSFRAFSSLSSASPFKRQLSLRVNDLPSNLARQSRPIGINGGTNGQQASASNGLSSLPNQSKLPNGVDGATPKSPASSSAIVREDTISEMCKELALGLQLMSSSDSPFTPAITSPIIESATIPTATRTGFDTNAIVNSSNNGVNGEVFSPILSESSSSSSPNPDTNVNWTNNHHHVDHSFTNKARLAPTPSSSFDTSFGEQHITSFLVNSFQPPPEMNGHDSSSNKSSTSSWVSLDSPARRPAPAVPSTTTNGTSTIQINHPSAEQNGFRSIKRVTKTTLPASTTDVPTPPVPRSSNSNTSTIIVRDPFDAEWAALSSPTISLPVLAPTTTFSPFNGQITSYRDDTIDQTINLDDNNLITTTASTSPTKSNSIMMTNNRIEVATNPFLSPATTPISNNISKAFEVQM